MDFTVNFGYSKRRKEDETTWRAQQETHKLCKNTKLTHIHFNGKMQPPQNVFVCLIEYNNYKFTIRNHS